MKISLRASIVACMVLASGGSLRAQHEAAGVPPMSQGYAVGHSQPAYPVTGSYLPPAYSAEELLWFRGEYLLWWFKDADIPPLVTTGSPADAEPGALGQPGTRVLFGDEIDYDSFNGARFTIGGWFDAHRTFGAEVNWFLFDSGTEEFRLASPGDPLLARPLFNAAMGAEQRARIANPGQRSGRIDISSSSRLVGFEINGLLDPWYDDTRGSIDGNLDLLYGFRYADLEEDLRINDASVALVDINTDMDPAIEIPAGTQTHRFDLFDTRNRFYGGQVGARWQARRGPVSVRLQGKLALGATHQNVRVDGRLLQAIPGVGQVSLPSAILARSTNIGEYSRDEFSVIPEIGAYVGYDILDGLSVYAGYTFLYWTNVLRPGDQIDRAFGLRPGAQPRPAFDLHETDFWAHGLSLGASLTF